MNEQNSRLRYNEQECCSARKNLTPHAHRAHRITEWPPVAVARQKVAAVRGSWSHKRTSPSIPLFRRLECAAAPDCGRQRKLARRSSGPNALLAPECHHNQPKQQQQPQQQRQPQRRRQRRQHRPQQHNTTPAAGLRKQRGHGLGVDLQLALHWHSHRRAANFRSAPHLASASLLCLNLLRPEQRATPCHSPTFTRQRLFISPEAKILWAQLMPKLY